MALIVEDGTIVTNANSYASLSTVRSYALLRGVTLSATDSVVEAQVIKSMDYIESFRNMFQGSKVESNQSLQFPRCLPYINSSSSYPYYQNPTASLYGIIIDGFQIGADEIPKVLVDCLCQCVMFVHSGFDFNPKPNQKFVTKEKVGAIQQEYSEKIKISDDVKPPPLIMDMLQQLFDTNRGLLTTERA